MSKKSYRIFFFFLWVFILIPSVLAHAGQEEGPGTLYAHSAVLMDASSGRVLYEKNGQEFLANASTTKILTCILALEEGKLEDLVSVSAYAASMPDVQLNIREGEYYLLEDLLYSLMLESHNDSAVAIAEHIAGSCQAFSQKMNEKARQIGCKDSWFITPNGLDASQTLTLTTGGTVTKEHGTTAKELALIMRYCLEESPAVEEFLKITRTSNYSFCNKILSEKGEVSDGARSFSCQNHNSFLQMMEGALSGKTGFTSKAGYCYIGALKQDERTYIVALLACGWPGNRTYKWKDTRQLMEYGLDTFELHSVEELELNWEEILLSPVEEGQGEKIGEEIFIHLERSSDEEIPEVLLKAEEKLTAKVEKKPLTAPIKRGEKAGEISYYINEEKWKSESLNAGQSVSKIDPVWCLKCCFDLLWM
ncbi:MAG: D-alanyl-D-alanine carboxypeptidase [Lachnospiraceae bacterium]|nr:D-alanyl-D-alanine carboxypeptidase [Lachnospiraceae bacterium]